MSGEKNSENKAEDFISLWKDKLSTENLPSVIGELQKENELFYAYTVPAIHYCTYVQMDSQQILIDKEGNEIISCESAVIDNKHSDKWKYDY